MIIKRQTMRKRHTLAFNQLFGSLLLSLAIILTSAPAHGASGDLFTYPVAPDTLMQLQPRCDYLVMRFWDRCNFDQAFRNPEKFNAAFGDWILIMQHASADSANAAVNKLVAKFNKKGPETVKIASVAEGWLYSDTTQTFSENIYLPFAVAASQAKKVSNAEKARFAMQAKVIQSSGLGANVPNLELTLADGSKKHLDEIQNSSVLIFINDPSCDDCRMARVRLAADFNTRQLIERGELAIVSIYPDEPDDQWKSDASAFPEEWIVGALADADMYFDLRESPAFFFLNSRHKVLAKNLDIDYLLKAFRIANNNRQYQ